jgi:hypothetical protein
VDGWMDACMHGMIDSLAGWLHERLSGLTDAQNTLAMGAPLARYIETHSKPDSQMQGEDMPLQLHNHINHPNP